MTTDTNDLHYYNLPVSVKSRALRVAVGRNGVA